MSQVSFSVAVVGLNNSGKSTILKSLQGFKGEIFPTAGFSIEYVKVQKIQKPILCYDNSGTGIHRENWKTFYPYADAILFVIDASDQNRFKYAKEQFNDLLKNQEVIRRKLPVCVALNKSDRKAYPNQVFYQALGLDKLQASQTNKFYLKDTCAYTKQGIEECFLFFSESIKF